ncbi:MAG: hypothetical protein BHW00_05130 [Clostridium sp. 26_22]|nr:MAG: hypothetical protein BHW00_05130 [Clostridium sp. 26_22]
MEKIDEVPNIKENFKIENLCVQYVYQAKEKYNVIYINSKLYEEIFKEKYEWQTAKQRISDMFSITLDEEKSNKQIAGKAYSDKQLDPTGIALSGNLGSGRAFFYKNCFNIKGDKTKLATAPKNIYSNGKYALSAAIKETVIANILADDFIIQTFETLAILDKKERFDFEDEYMDADDVIRKEVYNLPCSIEIRVNKEKELYRISNSLINKDKYTINELEYFCEKLAKIEANKFCDRFLHGSWSVGNISIDGNLIDFDTATFVKGRYPQYSNTNKYKSNYFGYELLGQKLMIKSILDYENIENANKIETNLDDLMNEKYKENMKIRFCDLIGLNYNLHYKKYNKYIDSLYEKFNVLSRKFLPNYYETNVAENSGDITYLFDFSKFFQKYLITKKDYKNNILLGMKLLLNDTEYIEYEKIGMIKEKIQEFFYENIVDEKNIDNSINNAMDFIEEYDELFNLISKETELSNIKVKQYIINANRNYLYGNENIYGEISYLYDTKKIDEKTTNRIINALINTNKRNNYNKKDENKLGLQIYEDLLTYLVLSENYYYLVIEPYSNTEIEFAKAIINGQEVMMRHFSDENGNIMVSEKTEFDNLPDILNFDIKLKINGKEYKDKLI